VATLVAATLSAQPPSPPPPVEYDVIIRYRIDAARTERIVQFRQMVRYLESIGFSKDPSENENEAEDREATEMTGHIASANMPKILAEPHVRTIMLFPRGAKLPSEGSVRVGVDITAGLRPDLQRTLFTQTRNVLKQVGLQEGVGYDHR